MLNQDTRPSIIGRFKSVEAVSAQIFENMLEFDQTFWNTEQADNAAAAKGEPVAVSLLRGAAADTSMRHTQIELLWGAIGAFLQGSNIKALAMLSGDREHVTETDALPSNTAICRDFSYHTARRQLQLPEGIEPLKGKPSLHTDDQLLRSIRELVDEQDRERKEVELEVKRKLNLQKLPPLEPQAPEIPNPTLSPEEAVKSSLIRRARLRLRSAFMKDVFLVCILTTWFALAAMVFIDPTQTTALCLMSLLLLFVACYL